MVLFDAEIGNEKGRVAVGKRVDLEAQSPSLVLVAAWRAEGRRGE